ncbi:UNVERIFIED_CONTAM: hypothetical protein GTU68_014610 [Idotea baltica]|nr:hypothetical protein [Idotea baltica]
MSVPAILL